MIALHPAHRFSPSSSSRSHSLFLDPSPPSLARRRMSPRAYHSAAQARLQAHLAAVLDAALDCIVTIDHEGRFIDFNPAAERTFGWRRDEVIGREMAELIVPPALRERHRAGLARLAAG